MRASLLGHVCALLVPSALAREQRVGWRAARSLDEAGHRMKQGLEKRTFRARAGAAVCSRAGQAPGYIPFALQRTGRLYLPLGLYPERQPGPAGARGGRAHTSSSRTGHARGTPPRPAQSLYGGAAAKPRALAWLGPPGARARSPAPGRGVYGPGVDEQTSDALGLLAPPSLASFAYKNKSTEETVKSQSQSSVYIL